MDQLRRLSLNAQKVVSIIKPQRPAFGNHVLQSAPHHLWSISSRSHIISGGTEEITQSLTVAIDYSDARLLSLDNLSRGPAKVFQNSPRIVFGSQLLAQIDKHAQPSQIRVLKFQVFFPQQPGLPFDFLSLLKQLHKDGYLRSQNVRFNWLNDVVHRAEGISTAQMAATGTVGGEKNNWYVTRPIAAPDQLGGFQTIKLRHVNVHQNHCHFVVQQITERIVA